MDWSVDPRNPMPIYAQLMEAIRRAIAVGHLGEGDQLPTVRQMAVELKVNPNTVARAYSELEREGAIATKQGRGTFVLSQEVATSLSRDHERLATVAHEALVETHRLGFDAGDLIETIRSLMPPSGAGEGKE